jgi:hypothetical protein
MGKTNLATNPIQQYSAEDSNYSGIWNSNIKEIQKFGCL